MKRIALCILLLPSAAGAYDLSADIAKVKSDLSLACRNAQTIALNADGGVLRARVSDPRNHRTAYDEDLAAFTMDEAARMRASSDYRVPDCDRASQGRRMGLMMLMPAGRRQGSAEQAP